MLAPSLFMFFDSVVYQSCADPVGQRGGVTLSPGTGTTLAAYVETTTDRVSRADADGAPRAVTRYHVFLYVDPGVAIDDRFLWQGKTLSALGPAILQGAVYLVECQEIR